LALANILGEQCCDVEKLFKAGKMEEAKLLQHRLIDPNIMVSQIKDNYVLFCQDVNFN
jgi:dihydrodipicolinate synthase/N-acetylneuraminate lyase